MGKINYEIEIEIFKGKGCDHHRLGEKYRYPEDIGNLCPWLLDSINSMIRVLQFGGTLPWKYKDTEYEKRLILMGSQRNLSVALTPRMLVWLQK